MDVVAKWFVPALEHWASMAVFKLLDLSKILEANSLWWLLQGQKLIICRKALFVVKVCESYFEQHFSSMPTYYQPQPLAIDVEFFPQFAGSWAGRLEKSVVFTVRSANHSRSPLKKICCRPNVPPTSYP